VIVPSRDFLVVVDPPSINDVVALDRGGVVRTILELKALEEPLNIRLVLPTYLFDPPKSQEALRLLKNLFSLARNETQIPKFELSRDLRRRDRERIERGAEGDFRGLRLLALAQHVKADGVVTNLPSLIEPRFHLRRLHGFRIFPPADLSDFVAVCSRGHSLFVNRRLSQLAPDIFYMYADPKGRRLFLWFNKASPTLADDTVREHLRSALLNRYAFILYARDMTQFYELQKQYYLRRRGRPAIFRGLLNYHLTAFYVHLWGMLDTLAGIANRHFALGIEPRQCYLNRDEFLDALRPKSPGLARFIKEHRAKWVSVIGDVRHPVAHSALLLQQDVVVHTKESKQTDEQILAIVREEEQEFLESLPPDVRPSFEATLVYNWRQNRMKVENDDVIYVQDPTTGGGYFRGPVVSIDFDLQMLNAFIDAFLFACFAKSQ
jgi:hypothetical protein